MFESLETFNFASVSSLRCELESVTYLLYTMYRRTGFDCEYNISIKCEMLVVSFSIGFAINCSNNSSTIHSCINACNH